MSIANRNSKKIDQAYLRFVICYLLCAAQRRFDGRDARPWSLAIFLLGVPVRSES